MFIFCWEFCCLFLYIHDIVFLYLGLVWRVQEVVIERWLGLLNIHVIPKWFPSWFVILLCHPTRLGTFMFRIQKKSAKPHRGMMVSDSTQKMIVEFKGQRKLKHYLKGWKRHFYANEVTVEEWLKRVTEEHSTTGWAAQPRIPYCWNKAHTLPRKVSFLAAYHWIPSFPTLTMDKVLHNSNYK